MSYVKLPEVCEILDSRRVPVTKSKRVPGPYPYYGANGIQDSVNDYIFDEELVLLAEDGGRFGTGEPIAYRVSGKCWVNNHAHVLRPRNNIDVDYLHLALKNYDTTALINGATRKKLTQAAMREMVVPLRSMSEQLEIAGRFSALENRHAAVQCDESALPVGFSCQIPVCRDVRGSNASVSFRLGVLQAWRSASYRTRGLSASYKIIFNQ